MVPAGSTSSSAAASRIARISRQLVPRRLEPQVVEGPAQPGQRTARRGPAV